MKLPKPPFKGLIFRQGQLQISVAVLALESWTLDEIFYTPISGKQAGGTTLRGMVVGGLGKQKYLEDDEERRMSSKVLELNITFRHTFLNIVKYLRILKFN